MARKILRVQIVAEGRDIGKVFILTEMAASKAERWALKALSALVASGVDIPDNVASGGLAAVARMGIQAFGGIKWEDAEPLLEEMFGCVVYQPGANPDVTRPLIEDDIEEISTRIKLRTELFKLHMDFLNVVAQSIPESAPT